MEPRTLRLDLARVKSRLRIANDNLKLEQATREQATIEAAGGAKALGANAEDRARALTIALGSDKDYQDALKAVRQLEYQCDGIEALIADVVDERRRQEMIVRDKLADALLWNVGSDLPSATDDMFDDALAQVGEETLAALNEPKAQSNEEPTF